jgi:hypothetical protein
MWLAILSAIDLARGLGLLTAKQKRKRGQLVEFERTLG